jgi:hypothetical protein
MIEKTNLVNMICVRSTLVDCLFKSFIPYEDLPRTLLLDNNMP